MKIIHKTFKFITSFNSIIRIVFFISLALIALAMFFIFQQIPNDYLQGELVKIMYIHVPFAWTSVILYTALAGASLVFLIKNIVLFDIFAKCSANILLIIITIVLITGSIWGKPAWGTWWVWDARLTSMLILFFITLSYVLVRNIFYNEELSARISAITAVVGFLNIPIIKFSVYFWSTLHQKSTFFRIGGPSIHYSMIYPIIIMFIGLLLLVCVTIVSRMKLEILIKKFLRTSL